MDLKELPWWKGGYNIPEYLPVDELLKRIDQVPLTVDLVKSFLDNWVLSFHTWDMDFCDAVSCAMYPVSCSNLKKFMVAVNSRRSLENKAESLIHESVHSIYCARDTEKLEPIIEDVSNKLYSKNRTLFNSFVDKYLPKN